MSDSTELPEYQIFSILRQGEQEPIGPYSQNELVELLKTEQIRSSDLVYYSDLTEWKPLSEVFDLHENIVNFEDHGQDRQLVNDAFEHISGLYGSDEPIYYIAVQDYPAVSLTTAVRLTAPQSLALTEKRFCVITPKLIGDIEFEEYLLDQVAGVSVKLKTADDTHGAFRIVLHSGERIEVDKLPVAQLNRLRHLAEPLVQDVFHSDG